MHSLTRCRLLVCRMFNLPPSRNVPPPSLGCFPAVVPPAYACLDPDMSLSLGQTMALIFPPDDPKGETLVLSVAGSTVPPSCCLQARLAAGAPQPQLFSRLRWLVPSCRLPTACQPPSTCRVPGSVRALHQGGVQHARLYHRPGGQPRGGA